MRAFRVLLHRRCQLAHAGCSFFQRRGLLFRAGRQVQRARRNFTRGGGNRFAAVAHGTHRFREACLHALDTAQQGTHFVVRGNVDTAAQITRGDGLEVPKRFVERAHDRAAQCKPAEACCDSADEDHCNRQREERVEAGFSCVVVIFGVRVKRLFDFVVSRAHVVVERTELRHRNLVDLLPIVGLNGVDERHHRVAHHLPVLRRAADQVRFVRLVGLLDEFLPPLVGLVEEAACTLHLRGGVGIIRMQRDAVERQPRAGNIDFRVTDIGRGSELVLERVAVRAVGTIRAYQPQHADDQH